MSVVLLRVIVNVVVTCHPQTAGNSFGYGCERFHPNLELDRPLLTLRSVKRHAPSFETIRIFNAGKDPAVFQLERDGAELVLIMVM